MPLHSVVLPFLVLLRRVIRLLAVCAGVAYVLGAAPTAAGRQAAEVRGLWVPRTSLSSPERITAMVRAAQAGGFNTLLLQVRGRGEAFYRSDIEPRASDLDRQPASFDPLAFALDAARAANLRVHAWVNVNLVASGTTLPRSREHVAMQHPEWLMAPRALAATLRKTTPRSPAFVGTLARWTRAASAQVEGLYLSPIPAASRAYTTSVVREIAARYAIDGIHLDYIRYPGVEFDHGPAALNDFRAAHGPRVSAAERARIDRAARTTPTAWVDTYPEAWAAFRRARLTALVRQIAGAARAARPTIAISAAVVPEVADAHDRKLQDWLGWARAGLLDVACPMIYTTDAAAFEASVTELAAALGETPLWAGIGAWRLPIARTIDRVRVARRRGVDGVLLFSYDQLSAAGTEAAGFAALRPVLLEPPSGRGGTPH